MCKLRHSGKTNPSLEGSPILLAHVSLLLTPSVDMVYIRFGK